MLPQPVCPYAWQGPSRSSRPIRRGVRGALPAWASRQSGGMVLRVDVVSLFPRLVTEHAAASIVGRARRRGRRPGMVLAAPPLAGCLDAVLARSARPVLLMTSPQGRRLDQARVAELAAEEHLVILCGHYEGIDERIVERYRPEEFSIGDLVLSGGELPALVLVDAVTRLLPGALGDADSAVEDSFDRAGGGLLDAPCYTRPEVFDGMPIPSVLRSGDHAAIAAWRRAERERRTRARRPDLL